MARKSKYNREYHVQWIRGLAQRGLTIEQMAEDLSVAPSTLKKWIAENEELSDAVKKGRSYADAQVEMSLYKRAIGYTVKEKHTVVTTGKDGKTMPAKVDIKEVEIAPDTTACIFWLKNRRPDIWRDRVENQISGEIKTDVKKENVLKNLPDELLEQVLSNINATEGCDESDG